MISVKQIFKLAIFAAIIAFVLNFMLNAVGNNLRKASERTAGGGIYDNASGTFGAYSKMARLSLKQPDESLLMPVKGVKVKQIADTW
ncbi:hypothetical protein ELE62_33080, partial [Klebsiella pneumoniae]|nr:hypothetical protein [Klebsiella pneumoniae]